MNTYGYSQVSWNPEPTSCNFKAHVVAASKMYWHIEPHSAAQTALQPCSPSPQDSATSEPRRPGIGAKVCKNQRYQRNVRKRALESLRILKMPNWFNQWESLEHLDAVATSLKLQPVATNSIEIIVLPFWKWMNTYGYSHVSWNPEPTSCNFKAHVVAASKMYWHMEPPMFSPDGSAALRPLVQARPQRHHLSAWSSQEVLIEASVSRSYVACDPHWEPLNRLPLPASQWCW